MIEVRHLSKIFPSGGDGGPLTVLKDVNCAIGQGEVISIIGPSGTGKSTFLRCLNRLEEATSGQIIIDGEDILSKKANLPLMRRKMGMVFQNFNLFNHLNVLDNVTDAPRALLGLTKKDAQKRGLELLEMVGLADKAFSMPSDLSGGQKQRVAIARCLAMDPKIILFDEPTSALDPTMVGEVLSVIKRLAKMGLMMLIVTHEMKFARDVSTRIFFMNHGVIFEDGTPQQIFETPSHPETQAFIRRIRSLTFEVTSRQFDIYDMNSRIAAFVGKYFLSEEVLYRLQSCFEELITEILPLAGPATLKIDYSEQNEQVTAEIIQRNWTSSLLENDSLSAKLVKGYLEEFSEETLRGSQVLRMRFRK